MYFSIVTEFLIYDDACHLKKYATNSKRAKDTLTAERMASLNFVVDRFHFSGHVDPWCRQNCNPNSFDSLKKVSNFLRHENSDMLHNLLG